MVRDSTLPGAELFRGTTMSHWEAALRAVAAALPAGPAVVVLDEFPWLVDSDPELEGALQKVWDTVLEHRPVLFVLVGSDITFLEALSTHGRPLFGRTTEMVVEPFHPADTARMLDGSAAEAFDTQLVTGGFPRLLLERRRATSLACFLTEQLSDESSPLITTGERIVAAEFPIATRARDVLGVIGGGENRFSTIAAAAQVQQAVLARSLRLLVDQKRVVAVDQPVALRSRNDPRYRLADPALAFWWRFVRPVVDEIARGRPDIAFRRWQDGWTTYRGIAIEPLVRAALTRLAGTKGVPPAQHVGGWWTRTGDRELDLVGVDRWPSARSIRFVGSIKWRDRAPFGPADLDGLVAQRAQLDGAGVAPFVAVSRTPVTATGPLITLRPDDLLDAWR